MIELTIEEACKRPECFMYVWAKEDFLKAIDAKYAKIIRGKQANQKKVLMLSAEKYLGDFSRVKEYYEKIGNAFMDAYGMTPYEALIVLAQGGTVAGKNWQEGVYGVGALGTSTFKNVMVDDQPVTVDPTTGHIFVGSKDITDESKTVYKEIKGEAKPYQLFSESGAFVFMSQYYKSAKKYYAQSYTDADGKTCSASTGIGIGTSDGADIWGNVEMGWDWLKKILSWLLSIFGISTEEKSVETLNPSNTLPNQNNDGFVSKAGMSTVGIVLLCAAAAGTLLMSKGKKASK